MDLPTSGKAMYLRHLGFVSVFRTVDKNNGVRHYAAFDPRRKKCVKVALAVFHHVHRQHWGIECYHRAIQGLCRAEKFFVRWKGAIRNHLFCVLRAFTRLEVMRWRGEIESWYSLKRHLFDEAVTRFIQRQTHAFSA